MIPMVNLARQYQTLGEEIETSVLRTLRSGQYILGPEVSAFESNAATKLCVNEAVSCSSGTEALHLALRALDIGPNDEVITPAFTFAATVEAIAYVGATPVFVDIKRDTFNIDPEQVAAAITPNTRAIMPVHLYGQPARLDQIRQIAQKHQLPIIEDAAQSFAATTRDGTTGSIGSVGCFSFFPSKNLGAAGDAGLITTQDAALAQRLRALRNHGSQQRYHHTEVGLNSRMDAIQAAVLNVKLKYIDDFNTARQKVAQRYRQALQGLALSLPVEDGYGTHIYHQFTLLCAQRDALIEALDKNNIASAIYYPIPLHRQPAFSTEVDLPVTDWVSERCLSLPICPDISFDEVDYIADVIRTALTQ